MFSPNAFIPGLEERG